MSDDDLDRHLNIILEQFKDAACFTERIEARRALRLAVEMAVRAERERCAKVAEECRFGMQPLTRPGMCGKIAAAIRARSASADDSQGEGVADLMEKRS